MRPDEGRAGPARTWTLLSEPALNLLQSSSPDPPRSGHTVFRA